MLDAEELTSAYILPRKDGERLYLDLFAKGEYRPELLFGVRHRPSRCREPGSAMEAC